MLMKGVSAGVFNGTLEGNARRAIDVSSGPRLMLLQ